MFLTKDDVGDVGYYRSRGFDLGFDSDVRVLLKGETKRQRLGIPVNGNSYYSNNNGLITVVTQQLQ